MSRLRRSIFLQIVASTIVTVLLAVTALGAVQYYRELATARLSRIAIASASLQPILALAGRGVDGGNLMILKNPAATEPYASNPDLLYLRISGTSAGAPATDFSDPIPPSPAGSPSVMSWEAGADGRRYERSCPCGRSR